MFHLLILLGLLFGQNLRAVETFKERLAHLQSQVDQQPTNVALLIQAGDLCHDEGVKDNKDAVKLAEKFLREALKHDPSNAPALALLGSTYTLKGRDAFWPGTQISLVKEGNRFMDAAVALATNDIMVRLTRAANNVHMPKFLGREEIARTDLAWLWEKVQAAPDNFPASVKQDIAANHGFALKKLKKLEDAIAVWEKGLAVDPNSKVAAEIKDHLKKAKKP